MDAHLSARTDDRAAARSRHFADLYRQHAHQIYRYALSRTGNAADAEDLTAQTFFAALRAIDQYRGDGSVTAWLTSIARNLSASARRQQHFNLPLDDDLPSSDALPEELALERLSLEAALRALDTLPDEYAEVVRLRLFSGLSTAETAALLGKTEAAAKMMLHRALQALRRQLAAGEQETHTR